MNEKLEKILNTLKTQIIAMKIIVYPLANEVLLANFDFYCFKNIGTNLNRDYMNLLIEFEFYNILNSEILEADYRPGDEEKMIFDFDFFGLSTTTLPKKVISCAPIIYLPYILDR